MKMSTQFELAAKEIIKAKNKDELVLIFTGAGVSFASGVPTFESSEVFTVANGNPEQFFEKMLQKPLNYLREVALFARRLDAAKPNMGHYAIAWLIKNGYAKTIITGNIDGLHEKTLGLGHRIAYMETDGEFLELGKSENLKQHVKIAKGLANKSKIMIISGWSEDEHGIIKIAKKSGAKIIEIGPAKIFASQNDIYIEGYSQTSFPELQKAIYFSKDK